MTVSITQYRQSYAGNGGTTVFPVPFRFDAVSDMVIRLFDSAGVGTLQTIATHYTVTGEGQDSGGELTMTTAPAGGETLLIERRSDGQQNVDLVSGGVFQAETVEAALDQRVLASQEHRGEAARAIRLHPLDPATDLTLPRQSDRVGRVLVFDENGQPTEGPDASDIANAQDYAAQAGTAAGVASDAADAAAADADAAAAAAASIPTGAVSAFNGRTGAVVPADGDYTKAQIGLGNADNTADADKPVSSAQQTALDGKLDDSQVGTGAGQLVALDAAGELPEISGANLTDLPEQPSGAWEFISSATASGDTSVDIDLPAGYYAFQIIADNIKPGTNASTLIMRTSGDGGTSFDTGSSDYGWVGGGAGTITLANAIAMGCTLIGSGAGFKADINVLIINPSSAGFTAVVCDAFWKKYTLVYAALITHAMRTAAASVDAVRFYMNTGTIATGTFKLYGLKAS